MLKKYFFQQKKNIFIILKKNKDYFIEIFVSRSNHCPGTLILKKFSFSVAKLIE